MRTLFYFVHACSLVIYFYDFSFFFYVYKRFRVITRTKHAFQIIEFYIASAVLLIRCALCFEFDEVFEENTYFCGVSLDVALY